MARWLSDARKQSIVAMRLKYSHVSVQTIAAQHGVSTGTVNRLMKEYRQKQEQQGESEKV